MSEKILDLDGQKVALTIVRATARMGAERGHMIRTAFEEFEAHPEFEEALKNLRWSIYPSLVTATTHVDGMEWPMPFEKFIELPEEFIDDWLDEIYKQNPHWVPGRDLGESDPKNSPKPKKH